MAIKSSIISFWKQVKLKSSDMFTLFKVGVGIKVPTHKLHVKDTADPLKVEGLQNDTTDPDKFLTIDSSNIVKYRTGAQVLTDIGGTPLTTEEVQDIAGALVATGGTKTGIAVTYQDATGDVDFVVDHDAATNFLAAEHVDWAGSSAGTVHSTNIPTLNQNTTGTAATVTAGTQAAITTCTNLVTTGTIGTGVWQGTAVASAYLDADTSHLSITQTYTGEKTFNRKLTLDGDKSVTPHPDGVTLHVDAQDITDTSTSGLGTATIFNHITIENPRIMASNALVTTTDASTVYIQGAPVASTNQTITNAYSLYVAAGNVKLAADLEVGGDLQVNGSNSNINLNAGSDIILEADNAGGSGASSIQYKDSGGGNKIMLAANSDVVILSNRASNGTVQVRANTSTAGSGGEVTVATFADTEVTLAKDLIANRRFTITSNTDGRYDGDVVYFGGTTSMTIGRIYNYKSDGTWEIANADAVATSDGLLAVALGAASDTNGMLLRGMVTLDHDPGAVGDVLYVQSDNAGTLGHATVTAPSASGDCVRIVGYCLNASNGQIWFNPDSTFVEVA